MPPAATVSLNMFVVMLAFMPPMVTVVIPSPTWQLGPSGVPLKTFMSKVRFPESASDEYSTIPRCDGAAELKYEPQLSGPPT